MEGGRDGEPYLPQDRAQLQPAGGDVRQGLHCRGGGDRAGRLARPRLHPFALDLRQPADSRRAVRQEDRVPHGARAGAGMITLLLLAGAVAAVQPTKADVAAAAPATSWKCARTPQDAPEKCIEDFEGIDATIHEVYEVISGPPGQKRDFDKMRSLFAPGATLK